MTPTSITKPPFDRSTSPCYGCTSSLLTQPNQTTPISHTSPTPSMKPCASDHREHPSHPRPRSLGGPSKWVPPAPACCSSSSSSSSPSLFPPPLSLSLVVPRPDLMIVLPSHQQSRPVQKDSFKLAPSPPASQLRFRPRSSPLRIPTPLPPLVPPALRIRISYVYSYIVCQSYRIPWGVCI
jgi:hypothetical protein